MGLKNLITRMKNEGYVVKPLENYLAGLSAVDSDRASNVNSPSSLGQCLRARYYSRTGVEADINAVEPRTRRIFDNGTYTHIRLQNYLKKQGMLLLDEVPVVASSYDIQGHTDGILDLGSGELAILEIKSINSRSFQELKDAKPEHKIQGLIYAFCIENQRKWLKEHYKNQLHFNLSTKERKEKYGKHFSYLQSGKHYSKEDKIKYQVGLQMTIDNYLYNCEVPITKVVFLYENKDTQDLKEYVVDSSKKESQDILKNTLDECLYLNKCVLKGEVPKREGTSKSCNTCRWCNYKSTCWVV